MTIDKIEDMVDLVEQKYARKWQRRDEIMNHTEQSSASSSKENEVMSHPIIYPQVTAVRRGYEPYRAVARK